MKILWYNWRCWLNPAMGGAEVFTREVAKRLVKSGHELTLFSSEFPGCKKVEVVDGIKIVRDGGRFSVYWQAAKYYKRASKEEKFDCVIDEINTRPFLVPKFAKQNEKIVALIHQLAREYWLYEMPFPLSYIGYHFVEDYWLKQYADTTTVTVSNSTLNDLRKYKIKDVYVVPEGLDFSPLSEMPEKNRNPIIVYSGRLKRAKRPDHALKAFNILRKKIPNAELWVLGDGPFKPELEKMGIPGVKFFDELDNFGRQELIKQSWVLVNPSVREGWGLNIVEANALGVPCVAYDVAGLRDSVRDGETGILANPGDIDSLAGQLTRLLSDPILRTELSQNALKNSHNFSWDTTASEFMKILQTA